MKLSEKLQKLRNKYHYSQEEIADICGVTRQSVSKWESNIALPEIEKLIILSNLFNISIDVLLKENLDIDITKINNICHKVVEKNLNGYYEGLLIKESITDENILDCIEVNKIELWKTKGIPKYWTALYFSSSDLELPNKLSKVMISDINFGGNWYADFKHNNIKYIVFKDKILSYKIGNKQEKELVSNECKKLGVLDISYISE